MKEDTNNSNIVVVNSDYILCNVTKRTLIFCNIVLVVSDLISTLFNDIFPFNCRIILK